MRSFITGPITVALVAVAFTAACDEPSDPGVEALAEASEDDGEALAAEAGDDAAASRGDVLARAWLHAFRRHLVGYPGGASPLEQRFAAALEHEELSDDELRGFLGHAEAALADVPEGEADALAIDEPLTDELLGGMLPALELAAPQAEPQAGGCPPVPAFDTAGKYRVAFEGFYSLAAPSENEWPWYGGEEVFLTWSLFTPSGQWSGKTDVIENVATGNQRKFLSGNIAPGAASSVSSDLLVMFRVFEKDHDTFYSTALTAAKAAAATAATHINWATLANGSSLSSDAKAVYDTLSKSGSANDDAFEVETVYFSEKRLWQDTWGCVKYPESSYPFGVPIGDYFEYAMRQIDSNSRWRTWVSFKRV